MQIYATIFYTLMFASVLTTTQKSGRDMLVSMISILIFTPIFGRVLGWW